VPGLPLLIFTNIKYLPSRQGRRCHLLAGDEVAAVAVGKVARKGITASTTGSRGVRPGSRSDIFPLLEGAVPDVDMEVRVIRMVAAGEPDPLRLWERGTTVAGDGEVGAHGEELAVVGQDTAWE
jgi:hypothetical protein